MEEYKRERAKQEKIAKTTGIVLTIGIHVLLLFVCVIEGLKYLAPPPPENSFLIDFSEPKIEKPKEVEKGNAPQAEKTDKKKPIKLVQKSEAPYKGTKANKSKEAKVDKFGDVEIKQPKQEKKIDTRALFPSADNKSNKDTLSAQTARTVKDALKAGHASGNANSGSTTGTPNAHLKGRKIIGSLPKPLYAAQKEGKVVVKIWVDQYGKVQKAIPGDEGTTVIDKHLWANARIAALKAHFNMSANAPALQEGTITYIFKLK